ncbi:MAG: radical SAM protein [Firmicutes bacterium]|nr:radical SAM protein [Bacillota bacterium]
MLTSMLRLLMTRSIRPFELKRARNVRYPFDMPEFGVYVHVPFCKVLCPFCPYYKEKYDARLRKDFVEALLSEIEMNSPNTVTRAESLYFGGGSPALLGKDLITVVEALKRHYQVPAAGLELHPDDVRPETLPIIRAAGFNMVSIGIQSFSDELLGRLGRHEVDGQRKVHMLQDNGFEAVDVDLIFGIPGQTESSLRRDFETAVDCGATQVSAYPFIDFSCAENQHKPLSRFHKKRMLDCLCNAAARVGFERLSVWTFRKRGTRQYSSVTRDAFIGYGPSAVSLSRTTFTANVFSVDEYVKSVRDALAPTALRLDFTRTARYSYWLFWNAYNLRISSDRFRDLFGEELSRYYGFELWLADRLGLLEKTSDGYALSSLGAYCFHLLEQHYTHQYIDKVWSACLQDPWPEAVTLF